MCFLLAMKHFASGRKSLGKCSKWICTGHVLNDLQSSESSEEALPPLVVTLYSFPGTTVPEHDWATHFERALRCTFCCPHSLLHRDCSVSQPMGINGGVQTTTGATYLGTASAGVRTNACNNCPRDGGGCSKTPGCTEGFFLLCPW